MGWTLTLHADAATGCMWIELEHGDHGRHVYATQFNQQYRGRFTTDPPELVRLDHGEPVVVAAAGETFTGSAQLVEGQLDECHVGPENVVALLY